MEKLCTTLQRSWLQICRSTVWQVKSVTLLLFILRESSSFFTRHSQCFCGNVLPKNAPKIANFRCNMRCAGNIKEKCGGVWKMNVFKIRGGLGQRICKFFAVWVRLEIDFLLSQVDPRHNDRAAMWKILVATVTFRVEFYLMPTLLCPRTAGKTAPDTVLTRVISMQVLSTPSKSPEDIAFKI